MIVDDEKLALSRLQRLLNENGIEDIAAFNNPVDALKEITKTKFDAVFLTFRNWDGGYWFSIKVL